MSEERHVGELSVARRIERRQLAHEGCESLLGRSRKDHSALHETGDHVDRGADVDPTIALWVRHLSAVHVEELIGRWAQKEDVSIKEGHNFVANGSRSEDIEL
jgi:hypothetical protein